MHTWHQHRHQGLPTAARTTVALVSLASAFVLVGCGAPTAASGDVHRGPADGDAISVSAVDNEFQPATLELEPGVEATIEVTNDGRAAHNLVIDDIDLSTGTLEEGDVATATFAVPDSPVTFRCSLHPGMEGEIRPSGS